MINFIKANLSDIPKIQDLAEKSWRSAYSEILIQEQIDYMLSNFYSEKELQNQMQNIPVFSYFLVEIEGEICGFTGIQHHFEEKTTKLHRIYFLPEKKGKGAGTKTLDFIIRQTKNSGDERIILNVNKDNPSKYFYKKIGFEVYDEFILDIGNGFVMDDFLMQYLIK